MKTFLTTLKGKIIAGAGTLVVAGAIAAAVIISNSGFRTIVVNAFNGITTIVNGSKTSEAYEGLHLKAGDDVTVGSSADLTLAMDEDKYVYAEPNTHFWVEAKGKSDSTKTKVYMDEGSNLFRIDDNLNEDEYFEVDTPNSTMSVRGTVFRVTCYTDANGEFYTDVEVYEGEVFVQAKFKDDKKAKDNRVFTAGECVTVHLDKAETVSEFLKSDNDYKMTEENYTKLRQETVEFLGAAADEGRMLCISKALLYDYAEITPHVWVEKILKEATDTEDGEMIEVCETCGKEHGTVQKIAKTGTDVDDDAEADVADGEGAEGEEEVVSDDTETAEVNPETCNHTFGGPRVTVEPTMFTEGAQVVTCTICGTSKTEVVNKLDIPLELMELAGEQTEALQQAECDHDFERTSKGDGYEKYLCSKCGLSKTVEKKKEHREEASAPAGSCSHSWVWVQDSTGQDPVGANPRLSFYCVHHQVCSLCGETTSSVKLSGQDGTNCSVCGKPLPAH